MNSAIFDFFGVNKAWDKVTDILLCTILAVFAVFGIMGIVQLVKRKNIIKVDKELVCMIPILILMVIIYAVFNKIWIINYRPVLIDGVAEVSFPSSHVLASFTLSLMMMIALPKYIEKKKRRIVIDVMLGLLVAAIAFGRVASGMHWFSDVCGGIVFGIILVVTYVVILRKSDKGVAKEKDR